MTYAAGQAEPNDSPILHAAIAMAPQIRAAGDEIERARRLPEVDRGSAEGRWCFRNGDASCLGRSGTRPADAVSRARGTGHGGWLGRLVRDDQLRRRIHHGISGSGRWTGDVSRPRGRYRGDCHTDRTGTAGARRLSRQRTFPVRQRLPTFRMGLARLCCHGGRDAACGRQWCAGNPAVHCEAVAMRDSRHVVHDRAARHGQQRSSRQGRVCRRRSTHSAFRTRI